MPNSPIATSAVYVIARANFDLGSKSSSTNDTRLRAKINIKILATGKKSRRYKPIAMLMQSRSITQAMRAMFFVFIKYVLFLEFRGDFFPFSETKIEANFTFSDIIDTEENPEKPYVVRLSGFSA